MISNRMRIAASGSRSVACKAIAPSSAVDRRALLSVLTAPIALSIAAPAFALIPDEEDEELLAKAKANRKAKLAAQETKTREFIQAEGLKDIKLDQELIPIQKGVYNLEKAGSQLEAGEINAASSTLSDIWVKQFEAASTKLGGADSVKAKLGELKAAASKGDIKASKRAYVDLVAAIQSWSSASGLELKGLN